MKKSKERCQTSLNRGITLIALVITIIVLLILAGVSLNLISGNDGILGKAQSAREKTVQAQEKEIIELAYMEVLTENRIDGTEIAIENLQEKINHTKTAIVEEVEEVPEEAIFIDSGRESGTVCKITMENVYYMYYKEADTRIKFYLELYDGQELKRTLTLYAPEEMSFWTWVESEYNQDLKNPGKNQAYPGGWVYEYYGFEVDGVNYNGWYLLEDNGGYTGEDWIVEGKRFIAYRES